MTKNLPFSLVVIISTLTSLIILPFNVLAIALPASLAAPANLDPPHCTRSRNWLNDNVNTFHCTEAVRKFVNAAKDWDRQRPIQFLSYGTTPDDPHGPTVFTPQRYVYGRCTVALTMLKTIPAGMLPGITPGSTFRAKDIARMATVVLGAVTTLERCVLDATGLQMGWTAAGQPRTVGQPESESIGILIYRTGSRIDQVVGNGLLDLGTGNTTLPNQTTVVLE